MGKDQPGSTPSGTAGSAGSEGRTYSRKEVQQWRDDIANAAADIVERASPAFGSGDWSWLIGTIRGLGETPACADTSDFKLPPAAGIMEVVGEGQRMDFAKGWTADQVRAAILAATWSSQLTLNDMVARFLCCPLPESLAASMHPPIKRPLMQHILTADEAETLLRHMLGGEAPTTSRDAAVGVAWLERAAALCDAKYKLRAESGLSREASTARALGKEILSLIAKCNDASGSWRDDYESGEGAGVKDKKPDEEAK